MATIAMAMMMTTDGSTPTTPPMIAPTSNSLMLPKQGGDIGLYY
jgi:hypothetical protein